MPNHVGNVSSWQCYVIILGREMEDTVIVMFVELFGLPKKLDEPLIFILLLKATITLILIRYKIFALLKYRDSNCSIIDFCSRVPTIPV